MTWRAFHVRRGESTRIDVDGELLGWGVEFPEGGAFVAWYRDVFPPEDRLEKPHVSQYGTLDDVEQGTGGVVDVVADLPMEVDL